MNVFHSEQKKLFEKRKNKRINHTHEKTDTRKNEFVLYSQEGSFNTKKSC